MTPLADSLEIARGVLKQAESAVQAEDRRITGIVAAKGVVEAQYGEAKMAVLKAGGKKFERAQVLKDELSWLVESERYAKLFPLSDARRAVLEAKLAATTAEADALEALGVAESATIWANASAARAAGSFVMIPQNANLVQSAHLRKMAREIEQQLKKHDEHTEMERRNAPGF